MSPVAEPYLASDTSLGYTDLDSAECRRVAILAAHMVDRADLPVTLRALLGPDWRQLARGGD